MIGTEFGTWDAIFGPHDVMSDDVISSVKKRAPNLNVQDAKFVNGSRNLLMGKENRENDEEGKLRGNE